MKSPKYLGSVKDMKRREKRAFDTEGMWHDQMSDVYEYFLPQRNLFETQNTGSEEDGSHIRFNLSHRLFNRLLASCRKTSHRSKRDGPHSSPVMRS
jgi:hypothetical protein